MYVGVTRRSELLALKSEMTRMKEEAELIAKQVEGSPCAFYPCELVCVCKLHLSTRVHTQSDAGAQRNRAEALAQERDALKQQMADLRDKLSKTQSELDDLKSAMENMVPRCVCVCLFVC
jgi:hypothetical protein